MKLVKAYVEGLKEAYYENGGETQWDNFDKIAHGVSKEEIEKLRTLYPDIPESLVQLLEMVDGTYWREYNGEKVGFYFLGSDIEEYPYYLLSAEQMSQKKDLPWLNDYINRKYEDEVEIDEEITDNADELCWLHFSDCCNNGGTSKLFIDFSPSPKGIKGQIVRYLHDPDKITVIADSFDEYLQMLIDNEYDFITEDTIDEWTEN
ncbi:MAG: SMI1/KNR4 family protein [Lachnospiraceae bacterium]|nr:SMI1/KNR4 family protein [Lachnospiraceae bacterium]